MWRENAAGDTGQPLTSSLRHPSDLRSAAPLDVVDLADELAELLVRIEVTAARAADDLAAMQAAARALVRALTAAASGVGHDRAREEDALATGQLEAAAAGDRDTPVPSTAGQDPQDPCACDGLGPWLGSDSRTWVCDLGHRWSRGVRQP